MRKKKNDHHSSTDSLSQLVALVGVGLTHNAQSYGALPEFDGADFASLISV